MIADAVNVAGTELNLRPASLVMQLPRLGSFHQCRISFMRSLIRRVMSEQWSIETSLFDLDAGGYGTVVYDVRAAHGRYSFVLFSNYLDPELRNDRVIATQWDLTMALCEGVVDESQLAALKKQVPKQEAGRFDSRVFVLSRANRSVRNFDYVVRELSEGRQPEAEVISRVGYLYRTTAVYGSGKLGMADWEKVNSKFRDFSRPFAAEMFTCYLLRHFSLVQADYLALQKSPATAVSLDPSLKRYFGIGNATGLGMAPYLINHPQLVARWVEIRETALAMVIRSGSANAEYLERLRQLVRKTMAHLGEAITEDKDQMAINDLVCAEMNKLGGWLAEQTCLEDWQSLVIWADEHWHPQTQEVINTLLIEMYPELVDPLDESMSVVEHLDLMPSMPLAELKTVIEQKSEWALAIDFEQPDNQNTFWYRSEEKLEPRLGESGVDPGEELEMPLAAARSISRCYEAVCDNLSRRPGDDVAHFVLNAPEHLATVRRVQAMAKTFYGEIRENLVHKNVLPMHLLRCKLAFFGANKFDPKSRLWVRNTMYQGAPLVEDIGSRFDDNWLFPVAPQLTAHGLIEPEFKGEQK